MWNRLHPKDQQNVWKTLNEHAKCALRPPRNYSPGAEKTHHWRLLQTCRRTRDRPGEQKVIGTRKSSKVSSVKNVKKLSAHITGIDPETKLSPIAEEFGDSAFSFIKATRDLDGLDVPEKPLFGEDPENWNE